jgi:hypothetical protein
LLEHENKVLDVVKLRKEINDLKQKLQSFIVPKLTLTSELEEDDILKHNKKKKLKNGTIKSNVSNRNISETSVNLPYTSGSPQSSGKNTSIPFKEKSFKSFVS